MTEKNHRSDLRPVRLLYWDYGKSARHGSCNRHSHLYWQLEIIISGTPELKAGNQTFSLAANDMALIPPRCSHRFNYFQKPRESWSFKFTCEGPAGKCEPFIIRDMPEAAAIRTALIMIAASNEDMSKSVTVRALLSAIISMTSQENITVTDYTPLKAAVCGLLRRGGGKLVTIKCLSANLGYSPDYLSKLVKAETGQSLKQIIDTERLTMIRRQLAYSEENIAETAAGMGFPDQFTFSHFFKRLSGLSPQTYKARCHLAGKER